MTNATPVTGESAGDTEGFAALSARAYGLKTRETNKQQFLAAFRTGGEAH